MSILNTSQFSPDRELDILIAEFITGQSRFECRTDPINRNGEPQFHWGYPHGHDFAPEYTRDIAAAFQFVDKITHPTCERFAGGFMLSRLANGRYWAVFGGGLDCTAEDSSPARAICCAGVKALRALAIYKAGVAAADKGEL